MIINYRQYTAVRHYNNYECKMIIVSGLQDNRQVQLPTTVCERAYPFDGMENFSVIQREKESSLCSENMSDIN